VAGFIIKMGIDAFHVAYDELMDAAPPRELADEMKKIILAVKGVRSVKKIMFRKTGIEFFIEVTIGVDGSETVKRGHDITVDIKKDIFRKMPSTRDVMVHVEPKNISD